MSLDEFPVYKGGEVPEDHVVYKGHVMDIDDMIGVQEQELDEYLRSLE